MSTPAITIVTVNWYSTDYLVKLLENLAQKATHPDNLVALIVDNTNGADSSLDRLKSGPIQTTLLKFDSQNMKSSRGHAAGLDFAMEHIHTPYCLIIDPDVHVFKKDWDQFCISEINASETIAIGSPYPGWKLGKYHDFPSPIFCFFDTHKVLDLKMPWTPFGHSQLYNLGVFFVRQIARLCGVMTRRNFEHHACLRKYGHFIEKLFGTFSQDTGWRIAQTARNTNLCSVVFDVASAKDSGKVPATVRTAFEDLAKEYELYLYRDQVMLTHKYGTGVYLWKTKRGRDKEYWFDCILQLETVS